MTATEEQRPEIAALISQAELFARLGPAGLRTLLSLITERHFARGERLIHEGRSELELFFLERGTVRVMKVGASGNESELIRITAGASVGEMKLIQGAASSASVEAVEPVIAWCLPLGPVLEAGDPLGLHSPLLEGLASVLDGRIRHLSVNAATALHAEQEHSMARRSAALFMLTLFTFICGYMLVISAVNALDPNDRPEQTYFSGLGIALSAIPIYFLIRRSPYPARSYGISLVGWRRVLIESVLLTLPLLAVLLLGKWVWLRMHPELPDPRLFHYDAVFGGRPFSWGFYLLAIAVYVVLSPFQELFCRCGLQGSIQVIRENQAGKTDWAAIIVSNLLFAAMHTHIGIGFAIAAFVPGLFWGWLYERQRSLLGVAVSHVLVGLWALYVVGVQVVVGGH